MKSSIRLFLASLIATSSLPTAHAGQDSSRRLIGVPSDIPQLIESRATSQPIISNSSTSRVFPAGLSSDELNDPLIDQQWHLLAPPEEIAGTGLLASLATPLQLDSVVVAVVDTGILATHLDIGKLLPGYDFVSNIVAANDGDGRDSDPMDPGDWVSMIDINNGSLATDCAVSSSTWHGTAVAGILAADTNNALGITGAAPHVQILPVRVMGRCGGTVADLIDGIRWAAGLDVQGTDINPNPAQVINLSLGYSGRCDSPMQNAINEVRAAGAVVVTAIGNGANALRQHAYSPASCDNVIAVAAADREGNFASYNNYGSDVDILAPGGVPGAGLTTLDDGGSQRARNDSVYTARYGSSIATPLVSASAALMIAANPLLEPHHIESLLFNNGRDVSNSSLCKENTCGAGLLDARLAVHAAATTDVRDLPEEDALSSSGGGGALHPLALLLLMILRQGRVLKVAKFMQHSCGKLTRR